MDIIATQDLFEDLQEKNLVNPVIPSKVVLIDELLSKSKQPL
jgi:hypothetical protein